jgi:hypothetical protein
LDSTLVIAGADRFEAQAEANEARIFAAASSGRWTALSDRAEGRFDPAHLGTAVSRLQRRPIGGVLGGALLQASLGPIFTRRGGSGRVSAQAGAGKGTITIQNLVVRWPEAAATAQPTQPKVSASLEHVHAPDRRQGSTPVGFQAAIGQSSGQPLPGTVRAKMEAAFGGVDLSLVRIHASPDAHALTASIHARAFATGNDVFFNHGEYDPHSARGLALLGHELTHVLQQRPGAAPKDGAPSVENRRLQCALVSPLGRGGLVDAAALRLQRKAELRASGSSGGTAPSGFGDLLGKSSGTPLPTGVQSQLESMFGADFGHVRVHTGENAATAARSINAVAFTHGSDIYFGAGQYDPQSARGVALIGHELTHVVQQGRSVARATSPRSDVRRKEPLGFFQSNKAYWDRVGTEGLTQGGTWGTTKAVVASLFAGFNDPFGELRRDSEPFSEALAAASGRYPGTLSFDDPQRRSWTELQEFFGRTGSAAFNRAPARGKIPSGEAATGALEAWLKVAVEASGGTTLEELIFQAISFNGGNVTLAMGSIAEILCKGKNRRWAAKIKGLRGNGKDYYIFAGAYVGMQPTLTERLLGWAGSHGNIGGNPLVYSGGGALSYAAAWSEGDQRGMAEARRLMTSRWGLDDNYNKFHEFNTGFLGATRLQRKDYEVAGHDALEQQALENERAIMRAFSSGGLQEGQPALLALGASTKVARREELRRAEETPVSDRWWSRHAVGAWGVARALWDIAKPGSRGFEELRGEATSETVKALLARLHERRASVVWTPYVIYTEARALSPTRREALQLSLALLIENYDLPLAPMPGIDPEEPLHDKYEHFFASAVLAHRSNAMGSFTVGWLKEVGDQFGTGYSEPDLMADALGAEFGQNLQSGEPTGEGFPLQSGGRRSPRQVIKPLRRAAAGRDPLEDLADDLDPRSISRALREPGLPLEQALREKLERSVGADLGNVRVHTGEVANRLARSIGAEAFTVGTEIFLGDDWRGADTAEGVGTLVHEATHVAQANQGRLAEVASPGRTRVLEAEAYAHERAFLAGAPAPTTAPTRAVARPIAAPAPQRPGPDLVMREAPRGEDVPAPEAAPVPSRVLKKPTAPKDPIQRVMDTFAVGSDLSREEFLETCTERVLELMREEMESDAERGATNMAWSYDLPMS